MSARSGTGLPANAALYPNGRWFPPDRSLAPCRSRVPIPGTRQIGYLEENAAAEITLTEAELAELDEAAQVGAASGDRYPVGHMSMR